MARRPAEGAELLARLLFDPWAENLDRDLAPVFQQGAMRLRDRSRGDRRRKAVEQLVRRFAEGGLDLAPRRAFGKRRHLVLQPAEVAGEFKADDVGPGRHELAELHIGGPEPLEGVGEALAGALSLALCADARQRAEGADRRRREMGVFARDQRVVTHQRPSGADKAGVIGERGDHGQTSSDKRSVFSYR